MRATLYLLLGTPALAIAELTKALELNHKLTRIRYERARGIVSCVEECQR